MVPAYKRNTDSLTVMNKISELAEIASRLVKREDIIPKKLQRTIASPLLNDVRMLAGKVMAANSLRTNIYVELEKRIELQYDAHELASRIIYDLMLVQKWAECDPTKLNAAFDTMNSISSLLNKWIQYSRVCATEIEQSDEFKSRYALMKDNKVTQYRYATSIKGDIPFFNQSSVSC